MHYCCCWWWCVVVVAAGAAKLLGKLQEFKLQYAAARAKEHPELQQVYADKIAAMKATGAACSQPDGCDKH
jgi:hypothetical protein